MAHIGISLTRPALGPRLLNVKKHIVGSIGATPELQSRDRSNYSQTRPEIELHRISRLIADPSLMQSGLFAQKLGLRICGPLGTMCSDAIHATPKRGSARATVNFIAKIACAGQNKHIFFNAHLCHVYPKRGIQAAKSDIL